MDRCFYEKDTAVVLCVIKWKRLVAFFSIEKGVTPFYIFISFTFL